MSVQVSSTKIKRIAVMMLALIVMTSVVTMIPVKAGVGTAKTFNYGATTTIAGVLEKDRLDYINASGNPLHEDIANALFQGPGDISGSETVGYLRSINLSVSGLGTVAWLNYTGEGYILTYYNGSKYWSGDRLIGGTSYHVLPVIEETPALMNPTYQTTPIEGWALAYIIHSYPGPSIDSGYITVTMSGFDPATDYKYIVPNVIYTESDDAWVFVSNTSEVWVDNPRITAIHYVFVLQNNVAPFYPKFEVEIVVMFNKATKFVQIFQRATLIDIQIGPCSSASIKLDLARMAMFDANAHCDRAYYGWKNVTIDGKKFFMVLSWVNASLDKWVRVQDGYDYYADYMVAYPIPDAWAIGSDWRFISVDINNDSKTEQVSPAALIWATPMLANPPSYLGSPYNETLNGFVWLNMSDIDRDGVGDGDQALVRFDWYAYVQSSSRDVILANATIPWKMIMYGVYDVNGTKYSDSEGGNFNVGTLVLSNGSSYNGPQTSWTHMLGSLGYLDTWNATNVTATEDLLAKKILRLDSTFNITAEWYPTEELLYQLNRVFDVLTFNKFATTASVNTRYLVIPAPGATTDAAGATLADHSYWSWANRTLAISFWSVFDVEVQNMKATIGYTNPEYKVTPYIMLRLENLTNTTEMYRGGAWKSGRVGHYLSDDGRALPQMDPNDPTGYRYEVVTIAGVHPNLMTYYMNDFSYILRTVGGDYPWQVAVLPTGGIVDISKYGSGKLGLGVISITKDHFGNIGVVVWGHDAQDTYWTAYYVLYSMGSDEALNASLLLQINYTALNGVWGDGTGIPLTHNTLPEFSIIAWSDGLQTQVKS